MNQRRLPGARPNRRPPAGPPSSGTSAGARGALLLGVAVILGIVLLQKFDTDVDTGAVSATSVPGADTTATTRRVGLTTVPATATTVRPRAKAEVKVVVANGAGVRGLAGLTTDALKALGYSTLAATDVTGGNLDKTSIQFVEGYEAEAKEVAAALNQPATAVAKLASPPVAPAAIDGAHVVVILGVDVSTTTSAAGGTTTTRRP